MRISSALRHLVAACILAILPSWAAAETPKEALQKHLKGKLARLATSGESASEKFSFKILMPAMRLLAECRSDGQDTAVLLLDLDTGIPIGYRQSGLAIDFSTDWPGRLRIYREGAASLQAKLKPKSMDLNLAGMKSNSDIEVDLRSYLDLEHESADSWIITGNGGDFFTSGTKGPATSSLRAQSGPFPIQQLVIRPDDSILVAIYDIAVGDDAETPWPPLSPKKLRDAGLLYNVDHNTPSYSREIAPKLGQNYSTFQWRKSPGTQAAGRTVHQLLTGKEVSPPQFDDLLAAPDPTFTEETRPSLVFEDGLSEQSVPARRLTNVMKVPVSINDTDPQWIVLDTGSPVTLIDTSIGKQIGLSGLGKMELKEEDLGGGSKSWTADMSLSMAMGDLKQDVDTTVCEIDSLQIGPLAIADYKAIQVANVSTHFDGLLGLNALRSCPFTLDYQRAEVTFHRPDEFKAPADARVIPIIEKDGSWFVEATFSNGIKALVEIDTGADSTLTLTQKFVSGADFPEKPYGIRRTEAVTGTTTGSWLQLSSLQILGQTFPNLRVGVSQRSLGDQAGVVGSGLLRRFRVTIDPLEKQLYLEPVTLADHKELIAEGRDINAATESGMTALLEAVGNGDTKLTETLFDLGAELPEHPLLGEAAKAGNLDLVNLLIDHGAQPDTASLNAAAGAGRLDIVKHLIQSGADPHAGDHYPPIAQAAANGQLEIVQWFHNNITSEPPQGPAGVISAAMAAAITGEEDVLRWLLNQGDVLDTPSYKGITPLRAAMMYDQFETALFLLDQGADPNGVIAKKSTLRLVAEKGHLPALQRLLAHPKIDLTQADAAASAYFAAIGNHWEVVATLLEVGLPLQPTHPRIPGTKAIALMAQDPASEPFIDRLVEHLTLKELNASQHSVMAIAIQANHYTFLEAFLKKAADPNAKWFSDDQGILPLIVLAATIGQEIAIDALIHAGADVNATGGLDEGTALHVAVQHMDPILVQKLLDAGADVNARDIDGRTPLMMAAQSSNGAVIKALLAAGADPKLKDGFLKTAHDHAEANETFPNIAKLLKQPISK